MADIKTHLRELSVAVGIAVSLDKTINPMMFRDTKFFFGYANHIVTGNVSAAKNILALPSIEGEYLQILSNGLKLGKNIVEKFGIRKIDSLIWCGSDTQKGDPTDLIVNGIHFSLKEHSFILENMGLYKFLSLLTTQSFEKGLHVFEDFAKHEYDEWFGYTWRSVVNSVENWTYKKDNYTSRIYRENGNIILNFNNTSISKIPIMASIEVFNRYTNGKTREKVFSKWINENLQNDRQYLAHKKACSDAAGSNICALIAQNISISGLKRLLQIRDFEYYYAKSTHNETTILKVPSVTTFASQIVIDSIEYSVPASQLNIFTTIKNKKTGNTITLRNECRFSHGQFNGTPEAKMYYQGDLLAIYEEV